MMSGGQIPGGQINYVGNGFGGGSGATRNGFPGCVLVEIENQSDKFRYENRMCKKIWTNLMSLNTF